MHKVIFISLSPVLKFTDTHGGYDERHIGLYQGYCQRHNSWIFSIRKFRLYHFSEDAWNQYKFLTFLKMILSSFLPNGEIILIPAYPSFLRVLWLWPLVFLLKIFKRIVVIVDIRDLPLEQIEAFEMISMGILKRLIFRMLDFFCFRLLANKLICVSEEIRTYIKLIYRKKYEDIFVIPPGSFPELFSEPPNINRSDHTFQLLYAGSFVHGKGVAKLINIVSECRRNGLDVKLILLGDRETGKLLIEEGDFIKFEYVTYDKIPYFFSKADLLLIPFPIDKIHLRYTLPVKLMDYLAAGKPVLSTPLPAVSRILRKYGCGISSDIEDWPKIICDMFYNRKDLMLMGLRGRTAVLKLYNWKSNIAKLEGIISNISS